MSEKARQYVAIDAKSFYASVECVERHLNPLTTNLVVADESRTEKTICLAVSPALKAHKVPGRPRLFEVIQRIREVNRERLKAGIRSGGHPARPGDAGIPLLFRLVRRGGACGRPLAGSVLHRRAAPDAALRRVQQQDLRHLSQVRRP